MRLTSETPKHKNTGYIIARFTTVFNNMSCNRDIRMCHIRNEMVSFVREVAVSVANCGLRPFVLLQYVRGYQYGRRLVLLFEGLRHRMRGVAYYDHVRYDDSFESCSNCFYGRLQLWSKKITAS